MKKRMKKISALLLSFVVVLSLVACGGKQAENGETASTESKGKVKILFSKESLCLAPVHIAELNGYFDEEFKESGVEYEFVNAEVSQAVDLITAGKIDAAYGLTGSLMQPISNGLAITFTTGLHTGCTKYYVKKGSDIKTLEQLKGKTIGVPSLSDSSLINLKRKLQDLGLNMEAANCEVTFVAYAMTDLPTALDNGSVDAIGIHDPVASIAEETYDFEKILDVGEDEKFQNEYCCQAYVSNALVESNPEGAAAYTRAMQRAAAFIEANPEEAARLQIENGYISGGEEEIEKYGKILDSFNYTPSVSLGKKTFEDSFKDLQKMKEVDPSLSLDEFLEKSYADLDNVPDTYEYDEAKDGLKK